MLWSAVSNGLRHRRPSSIDAPELHDPLWTAMEHCWLADPTCRPGLDSMMEALNATRDVHSYAFFPWLSDSDVDKDQR
jgi:hypothetical protein